MGPLKLHCQGVLGFFHSCLIYYSRITLEFYSLFGAARLGSAEFGNRTWVSTKRGPNKQTMTLFEEVVSVQFHMNSGCCSFAARTGSDLDQTQLLAKVLCYLLSSPPLSLFTCGNFIELFPAR